MSLPDPIPDYARERLWEGVEACLDANAAATLGDLKREIEDCYLEYFRRRLADAKADIKRGA